MNIIRFVVCLVLNTAQETEIEEIRREAGVGRRVIKIVVSIVSWQAHPSQGEPLCSQEDHTQESVGSYWGLRTHGP